MQREICTSFPGIEVSAVAGTVTPVGVGQGLPSSEHRGEVPETSMVTDIATFISDGHHRARPAVLHVAVEKNIVLTYNQVGL